MTSEPPQEQESITPEQLRAEHDQRAFIDERLVAIFAPEDDALQAAVRTLSENDMPHIQISPLQGRLLQVLAAACGAKKILEIGALSGYSSIWLARALPKDGRLISLEVSEKHARVARQSLQRAGLGDRAEVRVGPAEVTLGSLVAEAPFDLIFIDADKPGYPTYLDWALRLTRAGSIIVADNCVRGGRPLAEPLPADAPSDTRALAEYNERVASDPHLLTVALPIDEGGMDGLTVAVVLVPFTEEPSAEAKA